MTSAEFTAKYRILKTLTENGARSQIAQETALGRMVMVHSLDVGTAAERSTLLRQARSLDPAATAKVFEIVEVDGTHVVVTHFLTSFTDLPAWLGQHAGNDDIQDAATQIIQAVPRPATPPLSAPATPARQATPARSGAPASIPPKAPATEPSTPPAGPAPFAGDSFTKVFAGLGQTPAQPAAPVATVPPATPAQSAPPTPPPTPRPAPPPPGEFTRVFQGIPPTVKSADPVARPIAPAATTPPAASPPPLPPAASLPAASLPSPPSAPPAATFTPTVVPGKAAPTSPPPSPSTLPPPAARQPSFAPPPSFAPRAPAAPPPSAPANPPASAVPPGAESFTGVFGKLSTPPPPISPPIQPPKQSPALPSLSPGAARFDSVMPPVDPSLPPRSAPPMAPIAKPPASAGGDFTELFSRLETPGSVPNAPPSPGLPGGSRGAPSKLPPPRPVAPLSGRPGAAAPSEFTRILGRVSPPTGGAPAKPALPKPPGGAPPAAPPAELPKTVKSYLPLIIALNVVLLLAVILILYFVMRK